VTQIQLAVAYASLVNGGERIKPTIISKIINKEQNGLEQEVSLIQERKQIFKHKTSELLRS
jgi:penicillin binding protein transpeptidase domain